MSWWGWLLLGGNLLGYALTVRRIVGQLAWHFYEGGRRSWTGKRQNLVPDGEQWFGAALCGFILSLPWPIALLVAYGMAEIPSGRSVFYMPRVQRERLLRERIALLEREAGVR